MTTSEMEKLVTELRHQLPGTVEVRVFPHLLMHRHDDGHLTATWGGDPKGLVGISRDLLECDSPDLWASLRPYRLVRIREDFCYNGALYARSDGWLILSATRHWVLARLREAYYSALRVMYQAAYHDCGVRTLGRGELMSFRGFCAALWKGTEPR